MMVTSRFRRTAWLLFAHATASSFSPLVETEAVTVTVNLTEQYQSIDGFGFSEAFQRAYNIYNLTEPKRSQLVDLLFNLSTGAGFSIVRNGIGSSPNSSNDWMNTIEPVGPSSPAGNASYIWDGKDSGQLWLSQQAVSGSSWGLLRARPKQLSRTLGADLRANENLGQIWR
jgi:hypothetical protein